MMRKLIQIDSESAKILDEIRMKKSEDGVQPASYRTAVRIVLKKAGLLKPKSKLKE